MKLIDLTADTLAIAKGDDLDHLALTAGENTIDVCATDGRFEIALNVCLSDGGFLSVSMADGSVVVMTRCPFAETKILGKFKV